MNSKDAITHLHPLIIARHGSGAALNRYLGKNKLYYHHLRAGKSGLKFEDYARICDSLGLNPLPDISRRLQAIGCDKITNSSGKGRSTG